MKFIETESSCNEIAGFQPKFETMKVLEFDIKKGIYFFEITDLKTDKHSHPAMEILNAKEGTFSLVTDSGKHDNLTFAIIAPNIKHTIIAEQNKIETLIIECNNTKLKEHLFKNEIRLNNGIFTARELTTKNELIYNIYNFSITNNGKFPNDKRVQVCIEIMENGNPKYDKLNTLFTSKIPISQSRLSHLFKENMGISIQKYFVWVNLKSAIHLFLNQAPNLKEASFKAGFFDQAHFNNSYRKFFGRSPFKVFSVPKN